MHREEEQRRTREQENRRKEENGVVGNKEEIKRCVDILIMFWWRDGHGLRGSSQIRELVNCRFPDLFVFDYPRTSGESMVG